MKQGLQHPELADGQVGSSHAADTVTVTDSAARITWCRCSGLGMSDFLLLSSGGPTYESMSYCLISNYMSQVNMSSVF